MKKWLLASLWMAGMAMGVQAQEVAVSALGDIFMKQVADGHYRGARLQLEHWLDGAGANEKGREDAEALLLVCDYVLEAKGTADRMGEWMEGHPLSQYAAVLRVFRRNLLVKEHRFDEAVKSFFEDEAQGASTPAVLPYPLTNLSDEVFSYNGVLYRLAGEHLYDEGAYDRAMTYLEAGEKTRTSLYKLGMCQYRTGAFDRAYASLTESASVDQDEMAQNAWLHAGIAALQLRNREDAQKAFKQASQMSVNNVLREQALYNYALTLHEQSASVQTVAVMEQFLNEFPTSRYASPVSRCLTEVYMTKKDYSKALNALNRVQTLDADSQADKQKVLYNLAFQELTGNRVQEALTYAGQAIALGKLDAETYAESYYIKGDCNYRLGNYAQAANDLNTAIQLAGQTANGRLKNDDYAVYSLGYALFKQQKYNAAIVQFQKIVESEGKSSVMRADAYNRVGDCYLNMRDYDLANANYELAKQTDRSLGDYSMLQQAYIEGLRGNYDRKVDIINQMNTEYAGSALGAKAMYELGRAYVLSGREDDAASVFGMIAFRYPNSEYARKAGEELANMAANIAMQDSIAAAQDSMATEEAKAPVLTAQALFNAGQYQQAEQQLNQAIDKGISKPYWLARAFVLLSDIYKAEGRMVEAKQTLESLRANYKENDDIKEMIERRMEEIKH